MLGKKFQGFKSSEGKKLPALNEVRARNFKASDQQKASNCQASNIVRARNLKPSNQQRARNCQASNEAWARNQGFRSAEGKQPLLTSNQPSPELNPFVDTTPWPQINV